MLTIIGFLNHQIQKLKLQLIKKKDHNQRKYTIKERLISIVCSSFESTLIVIVDEILNVEIIEQ
jgi:hypothetical protein